MVALDANPDAGSLAHRMRRETTNTVTNLLEERDWIGRYADMRGFTSQSPDTRLEVVASDDDPRITQALGEDDYRRAIGVLDRHYNLVLVDTGTGILDSAIQGILAEADQVVVVMPPALDGARVAAMTLDWLEEHNHADLVRGAVAVVNAVHGTGQLELERIEEHFAARCRSVIRIPWDPSSRPARTPSLGRPQPADPRRLPRARRRRGRLVHLGPRGPAPPPAVHGERPRPSSRGSGGAGGARRAVPRTRPARQRPRRSRRARRTARLGGRVVLRCSTTSGSSR